MLNSIQFLRAFAAWIVVLHHYVQLSGNKESNIITALLYNYGSIGVDIFFIISGFVIYASTSKKTISPKEFAIHRIARIVPAYWLYTLITALTIIMTPSIMPALGISLDFFLKSMLFLPAQNPSGLGLFPVLSVGWTLNFEAVFYLIFALSLLIPKYLLAAGLFIGIVFIQTFAPKLGGSFAFYGTPIIYNFLFGVFIAEIYKRGYHRSIPITIAILIFAISTTVIAMSRFVDHNPLRIGLPCAAIMLALISQEHRFSEKRKINKLGDWSYSTYLSHPIIIFYVLAFQKKTNLDPTMALVTICAAVLLCSYVSYKYIELPSSALLKHIFQPKIKKLSVPN
jgi:exopolysaccharide production protein ExoZ